LNRKFMTEILIPSKRIKVLAEADVVVCGGGPAGITAAVSAARHGASVILLERWTSIGGMAVHGLVNIWHTSDRTKQVIWGLVQEAIERGGQWVRRYDDFPSRPETHEFEPEGMRITFQKMLDDARVRTICNLTAIESVVEEGRVAAVLVDTKTGRKAVKGTIFIDATGDGDIAANAGLPFEMGRREDGLVQGMTMMFTLRGIDAAAARQGGEMAAERVVQHMKALREAGQFPPFNEGNTRILLSRAGQDHLPYNMCPAAGNPLDEETLTRLTAASREQVIRYLDLWRLEMPGYAAAELEQTAFALGVRESRRVRGFNTLTSEMVVQAAKQPDAVGHGFWMIDIHDPRGSGYTTWTDQSRQLMPPVGESYHIPAGMCLNPSIANLAVVGRCASSTHEAHASVRLQSHCMVMGQGIGTLAALALERNTSMSHIPARNLQQQLGKDGVYIEDIPAAEPESLISSR
jgi:hypothetical protein